MKFEKSDGLVRVEDQSRAKVNVIMQEKEALIEASFEKMAISRDEVSIAKDKRSEASGSLTTERLKERLCELNREEENKTLYHMIRELEQMLKEQKEYSATFREENRQQTLGWRQVSETDDV